MALAINIALADFIDVQSTRYPEDAKYAPLSLKELKQHHNGAYLEDLLNEIGNFNPENIFQIAIQDGYPKAVYGFTITLNDAGIPSLVFGDFQSKANQIKIKVEKDARTGKPIYQAGDVEILFEANPRADQVDAFLLTKRLSVRARVLLAAGISPTQFLACKSVEALANCLKGTTQNITLGDFPAIQAKKYPTTAKYAPLSLDDLKVHKNGESLINLLNKIGTYNTANIFQIALQDGCAKAIYGFSVMLTSDNLPTLVFGDFQSGDNQVKLRAEIDPATDQTVFLAGNVELAFEVNTKFEQVDGFLLTDKASVRVRVLLAAGIAPTQLMACKSIAELARCLKGASSYSFKLHNITAKAALAASQLKFPIVFDVVSLDDIFQGKNFIARNINVKPVSATEVLGLTHTGDLQRVDKISIVDTMSAGVICQEIAGAARFLLCKMYGGTVQLILTSPVTRADGASGTPNHVLAFYPPDDAQMREAYNKAKDELLVCAHNQEDYYHLLDPNNLPKAKAPASLSPMSTPLVELDAKRVVEVAIPLQVEDKEALKTIDVDFSTTPDISNSNEDADFEDPDFVAF